MDKSRNLAPVSLVAPEPGQPEAPDAVLLRRIQDNLAALNELRAEASSHWGYEDPIYRFYHQSFKVYGLQGSTERIVAALRDLAPDRPMDLWFLEIVAAGTGKHFTPEANKNWPAEVRPIVEAFFHARYFLEMVCKYGRELESAPSLLPSGWAAVLCLYGLR